MGGRVRTWPVMQVGLGAKYSKAWAEGRHPGGRMVPPHTAPVSLANKPQRLDLGAYHGAFRRDQDVRARSMVAPFDHGKSNRAVAE